MPDFFALLLKIKLNLLRAAQSILTNANTSKKSTNLDPKSQESGKKQEWSERVFASAAEQEFFYQFETQRAEAKKTFWMKLGKSLNPAKISSSH